MVWWRCVGARREGRTRGETHRFITGDISRIHTYRHDRLAAIESRRPWIIDKPAVVMDLANSLARQGSKVSSCYQRATQTDLESY